MLLELTGQAAIRLGIGDGTDFRFLPLQPVLNRPEQPSESQMLFVIQALAPERDTNESID